VTFRIRMVPHDPGWKDDFRREAETIAAALGENVVRIHHIGSTAIPGIYAKPVIDFLLEVHDVRWLDEKVEILEGLGYEALGEFGIAGRRFYRKDDPSGERTHHVHAFREGDANVRRHIAFRDYMITHPDDAGRYSDVKRRAAAAFPEDIKAYMAAKDPFVKEHEAKALAWWASTRPC
jgi:GrpB-like predicted nucleotidyltransferase (UPF0157 family)